MFCWLYIIGATVYTVHPHYTYYIVSIASNQVCSILLPIFQLRMLFLMLACGLGSFHQQNDSVCWLLLFFFCFLISHRSSSHSRTNLKRKSFVEASGWKSMSKDELLNVSEWEWVRVSECDMHVLTVPSPCRDQPGMIERQECLQRERVYIWEGKRGGRKSFNSHSYTQRFSSRVSTCFASRQNSEICACAWVCVHAPF